MFFSMEKEMKIIKWEQECLYNTAVKKLEFVSDMVSFIAVRSHWCNINFLNVHAPSEGKNDDSKTVFIWI